MVSGTTTGTAFIQTLMAVFNTKTFTNSSEIVDTTSNIGLDLQNLSVAASSVCNYSVNIVFCLNSVKSVTSQIF